MPGFLEVQFPKDISYDSVSGLGFDTLVADSDSGVPETVTRRDLPRRQYNVAYGIRNLQRLNAVREFFTAVGGAQNGFRYSDPLDLNSNPTNCSYLGSKGVRDQVIGTGDGTTTQFQLAKKYTLGVTFKNVPIRKPVAGSVQVWKDGVLQTSGWTVNTTTGVVTFNTPPVVGDAIEASFEYDVPVMFAEDTDSNLAASVNYFEIGSIQSINLIEIPDPSAGNQDEVMLGGGADVVLSADTSISTGMGRALAIATPVTGRRVRLPNPATVQSGYPIFVLFNEGTNSFTLVDHLNTTIRTVASGTGCSLALVDTSGGKVWYAI